MPGAFANLAPALQTLSVHLRCGASKPACASRFQFRFRFEGIQIGPGHHPASANKALSILRVLANHHLSREYHYPYKTTLDYPFETCVTPVRSTCASLDYPLETQILLAITPSKLKNFHALPRIRTWLHGGLSVAVRESVGLDRMFASWVAKFHHRLAHVFECALQTSKLRTDVKCQAC